MVSFRHGISTDSVTFCENLQQKFSGLIDNYTICEMEDTTHRPKPTAEDQDLTISFLKANLLSLLWVIPISGLYAFLYALKWDLTKLGADITLIYNHYWWFLALLLAGIVIHELLHGLGWKIFGQKSWGDIRFGVKWRVLTPYAHCMVPMPAWAYRLGILLPGIVLGIIPYIWGVWAGNGWLVTLGFLFTLAAAGDFLMFWIIRKVKSETLLRDHPDRVGCIAVSEGKIGN